MLRERLLPLGRLLVVAVNENDSGAGLAVCDQTTAIIVSAIRVLSPPAAQRPPRLRPRKECRRAQ